MILNKSRVEWELSEIIPRWIDLIDEYYVEGIKHEEIRNLANFQRCLVGTVRERLNLPIIYDMSFDDKRILGIKGHEYIGRHLDYCELCSDIACKINTIVNLKKDARKKYVNQLVRLKKHILGTHKKRLEIDIIN